MNAEQYIRCRTDIRYLSKMLERPSLPKHAIKFYDILRAGQKENVPTYILASKESLKSTIQGLMMAQDLLAGDTILFGTASPKIADRETGALRASMKELLHVDPDALQNRVDGFKWQARTFCMPDWKPQDKDPSFLAVTVGQDFEGVRSGKGYLDDPADRKSMNSEAARYDGRNWLITTFMRRIKDGGWIGGIGSPWHEEDIYSVMINMGWEIHCFPRSRSAMPAIFNGKQNVHWHGEEYDWLYPERDINKNLTDLVRSCDGPVEYGLCYNVNPSATKGRRFDASWFDYWTERPTEGTIYMGVDLATGKSAHGDDTAIVVVLHASDNRIYILDAWGDTTNPLQTEKQIIAMADRYHPRKIFMEDSGQQIMFIEQLKKQTNLPIIAQSTETRDKISRIDTLCVPIESKKIVFHREQYKLLNELWNFPDGGKDDLPDALEMACRELLRRGKPVIIPGKRRGEREREMFNPL